MAEQSLIEMWPANRKKEEKLKEKHLSPVLTCCDANLAMKGQHKSDLPELKIWYKLFLNTLSRYGDRAPVTLPKIGIKCIV